MDKFGQCTPSMFFSARTVLKTVCISRPYKTLFCQPIQYPFHLFDKEKDKVIVVAKDKRQTAFIHSLLTRGILFLIRCRVF